MSARAYEAARAERAFHTCEPENRLVARSLETRWETKLRELTDAEAELSEQAAPAPEPSREQIEKLARDLPSAVGRRDDLRARRRKRLLRTLVSDVTITSKLNDREVRIGIPGAPVQPKSTRCTGRRPTKRSSAPRPRR